MLINQKKLLLVSILFFSIIFSLQAQKKVLVDQVVAVVGEKYILHSDIENQLMQMRAQQISGVNDCRVMKDLLAQKLLLIQAQKDSITVSSNQIESELERRLRYFIRQIGSEEKLENYYNKSIPEIKQDLRELLHEQMLTQQMQNQLMQDVEVSPREVKEFYNNLPKDSIPMVNKKVEINQIVKYPSENEEGELQARRRLLELRKRILEGERFSTLAVLYSDDPGTARKGGELGYRAQEELDAAFADAAFSLQEGEVSGIVESAYGFHIIKLIDREGDQVNVRHILIKPTVTIEQKQKVISKLDSIAQLIRTGDISFEKAAMEYSDDKQYKLNGGLLVNPMNSSNEFELEQLPNQDYTAIKDLKVGEISDPYEATDEKGRTVFKIVRLKSEIERHRANLEKDYDILKNAALQHKRQKMIQKWLKKKQEATYIHIDESFRNCNTDLSSY
jgi:peptidyl-prolyl cis-trans isomerase SurA